MPRIAIVHATDYAYRNAVGLTRHRLMVRPDDSHDLRLHGAELAVDPPPSGIRWAHDVFNNSICSLDWPAALRTQRLSIVSTLDLMHYPDCASLPVYSLEPSAELFPFAYPQGDAPDLASLTQRQDPDPEGKVDAWARRFASGEGETRSLQMIEAMTHAIRAEFRYGARHEEGTRVGHRELHFPLFRRAEKIREQSWEIEAHLLDTLGCHDGDLGRPLVRHFELAHESGVRVSSVERDSPAAHAGIRDGDIIVGFGDAPVTGIDDLHRMLTGGLIGDGVDVTVLRRNRRLALRVTLRESAQPRSRR